MGTHSGDVICDASSTIKVKLLNTEDLKDRNSYQLIKGLGKEGRALSPFLPPPPPKRPNNIQLLVFEESTIKIYWCVKGDVDRREAEVNITFHTTIKLDFCLFKHQLLFYYFSVSSVWLIMTQRVRV